MTLLPHNDFCPGCGRPLTGATNAEGKNIEPKPGDFTACAYCGTLLIFDDDLHHCLPTNEDLEALTPEMVMTIHRALRLLRCDGRKQ